MSNSERGPVIGVNRGAGVGVVLEVEPKPKAWVPAVSDETPLRILVLADLSGARSDRPALRERRPTIVDRDNFDDVLARFAPAWQPGPELGGGDALVFHDLDDFHADRLWQRLRVFAELRALRDRLTDPRTAERTARELLGEVPGASGSSGGGSGSADPAMDTPHAGSAGGAGGPGAPNGPSNPGSGSLLDAMLEGSAEPPSQHAAPPPAQSREPRDEIAEQIRRIVNAHRLPGDDPRATALVMRVDAAATDILRAVLHDRSFQRLEALWRALFLMTRRIETGPDLSIWVLDVTKDELASDLGAERTLETSVAHKLLVDEPGMPGAAPWSLLVGDYTFGPDESDVALLERLGELARRSGAPFLAAASPSLAGCPGFHVDPEPEDWRMPAMDAWRALRSGPSARFVGLALPRWLMRLPYGRDGEPCESFAFEEFDATPEHEGYLWANAAFACAILLAESFAQASWGLRPGMHQDLDGLPFHTWRVEGVAVAKPCAESLMSERAAARLLECGLMPLASMKDQDAVRLIRFQSVADPPAGLGGRWNTREG